MHNQTSFHKKLAELEILNQSLDREVDTMLQELKVTPAQLSAFLEKKEHFTDENWTMLELQRKNLDEKLERNLSNIPDSTKLKKTLTELRAAASWVRVN